MIYLVFGIAIIAFTNLGTLSIITRYIDKDVGKRQKLQKKRLSKKKNQTRTKKR